MAVGQHQWYHFGVGAPPILVYFSGDWDVRWGYGILDPQPCVHFPKRVSVPTNGSVVGLPCVNICRGVNKSCVDQIPSWWFGWFGF